MKNYIIQYWYNTDLRLELEVKAVSVRRALEEASDILHKRYGVDEWIVHESTFLSIRLGAKQ